MLEFCILGPVEARTGTAAVHIRGSFQSALLVTLLINGGRLVPADTLISELWGEEPPEQAENALQAHVSRLRRRLNTLEPAEHIRRVPTRPSEYRLEFTAGQLDAAAFTMLVEAERDRGPADPLTTVRNLRGALTRWRGPAFGGPLGGAHCQAAAARYNELRSAAHDMLFDAELRLGRHSEIMPEIRHLLDEDRFNERLCGQLMVALYRSGRQADALEVYRQMRRRLREQFGVEPSPLLRRYERAVLEHDLTLDHRRIAGSRGADHAGRAAGPGWTHAA